MARDKWMQIQINRFTVNKKALESMRANSNIYNVRKKNWGITKWVHNYMDIKDVGRALNKNDKNRKGEKIRHNAHIKTTK